MKATAFGVIDDARRRHRRRLQTLIVLAAFAGVGLGIVVGRVQGPPALSPALRSSNEPPTRLSQVASAGTSHVGCYAAVYGQLASGWRGPEVGTISAGPVALVHVRDLATDFSRRFPTHTSYTPVDGLAPVTKTLIVVNTGALVRVAIPASERKRLSLDWTHLQPARLISGNSYFRVSAGASQVTFHACPPGPGAQATQFIGGFIVAGAQCARLELYVPRRPRPLVRQIPIGVPLRACPATN